MSDLPGKFAALTKSAGSLITATVTSSVEGGGSFIEHSVFPEHYHDAGFDGKIESVAKIREGGWDYVMLQDQR